MAIPSLRGDFLLSPIHRHQGIYSMQRHDGIWFPDVDFVETITTLMVPVLFPRYDDGGEPDFQYLGGAQGRGLLESALAQPRQGFGGEYFYPSLPDKAAALVWSIAKNHPFTDGNKRAALTIAYTFLAFNRYVLLAGQGEAVAMCLDVAASKPGVDQAYVSEWIRERVIRFDEFTETGEPEKLVRYLDDNADADVIALTTFYRLLTRIAEQAADVASKG